MCVCTHTSALTCVYTCVITHCKTITLKNKRKWKPKFHINLHILGGYSEELRFLALLISKAVSYSSELNRKNN